MTPGKTFAVWWSLAWTVIAAGVAIWDTLAGRWIWAIVMAALTGLNAWRLNRNLSDS